MVQLSSTPAGWGNCTYSTIDQMTTIGNNFTGPVTYNCIFANRLQVPTMLTWQSFVQSNISEFRIPLSV